MSKISRIKINNALGINQIELEPTMITEISGSKGTGKTSFLDSIKMALTNKTARADFIKNGENEATLYIELDDGTEITRKKRSERSDYFKVKNNNSTEEFLRSLFSDEQFNPLNFMDMTEKEQNKVLLSLVEDNVTPEQMKEWFGSLPDFSNLQNQHILSKLDYLGSKESPWYIQRHDINQKASRKKETAEDLLNNVPDYFDVEGWKKVDLSKEYGDIIEFQNTNEKIDRATLKIFKYEADLDNINNRFDLELKELKEFNDFKRDKIQKEIDSEIEEIENKNNSIKDLSNELETKILELQRRIGDLRVHLVANNNRILDLKENGLQERSKEIEAVENEKISTIESNRHKTLELIESERKAAQDFIEKNKKVDLEELKEKANEKEMMKSLIPNYEKSIGYLYEVEELKNISNGLTEKIKLARELPSILLQKAELPIAGLKLENGIVKILNSNNEYVPVSNLSEGEKLELCIDIAKAKAGELKVILVDGFEKLDQVSRNNFIAKAKESGLQYFITRVADGELEIKEY